MGGKYRTRFGDSSGTQLGELAAIRKRAPNAILIDIEVGLKKYGGFINPSTRSLIGGFPESFDVYFWGEFFNTVFYSGQWTGRLPADQTILDTIGGFLIAYYQ